MCYDIKGVRDFQIQVRDLADISALNKLQLHAASSCVYFHDASVSRYVAQLWADERKLLEQRAGTVIEAPGFDSATGEPLGDIFHSFEPQLPYRLRLSFLRHDVIDDRQYRFSRRSQRSIGA